MAGPVSGIRVLDWCQYQQGNTATAMLADFGATVIHIEAPVTGDPGRGATKGRSGKELPFGRSWYFETFNRGKKSIVVDLNKEKGRQVIYRLVENSDVFVTNMRQGIPEKLGLDYETLRQHNPRLIYATASGYGPTGPEAKEPAFDLIGQARSGIMNLVGDPGGPPTFAEIGIADQVGGMMTSYGILLALLTRERFGIGQKVDASLLGSMIALQSFLLGYQLYLGEEATRHDRKAAANPLWNYYLCKDGRWLMLSMSQADRYWPTICRVLGIEHLEKDPKFVDIMKRAENCQELIKTMDEIFLTRTAPEWVAALKQGGDTICTPIQSFADLTIDPQVLANEYIVNCNHQALGPVKVIGNPVRLSETPAVIKCEAPEFGQHTEEVLIEVGGYTWDEIASLREEGVI